MDPTAEDKTLEKIMELVEEQARQRKWSTEEVEIIEGWIKAGRALRALGWLGGLLKPMLIGAGAIIAALAAIRLGLIDWLGVGKP
jgi:hypothetical protein